MNFMDIKVSIILITYNRASILPRAIESALRQKYDNLEVCIMDDASTDETGKVVEPYLKDKRVRYIKNPSNVGFSKNVQKALMQYITGEYFLVLSDDDELVDDVFICDAVNIHQQNHKLRFVFADYEGKDMYTGETRYKQSYAIPDGCIFKGVDLWKNLIRLQPYWGTCVFCTNQARECGGFWNSFSGMDVLFMLSIAWDGFVCYMKKNVLSMGVNGVTVNIHKSLDLQYKNMDFIRAAAMLAEYKGMGEAQILEWKEANITHLITLMFRDYVFCDNGKSITNKVMEIYKKTLKHDDQKCLILAQAQYMEYLYSKK